jgi:O-antigen/teichoic acid export membrane protein
MSTARNLFKSSLARTSFTVVSIVISFFMFPFLVHMLGDKWYGLWTIATSITGYYYLVDFGLATAVTRYVTQYISKGEDDNANQIINTSLVIYSALGFVIILFSFGICLLAHYFTADYGELKLLRLVILITGLNLALEFPFKAFAGIIGSYVRYDLLTYCHFAVMLVSTGLTVFFISSGYGVMALAVIGLVGTQVSNMLFYLISRHLFSGMQIGYRHVRKERVRKLFSYSIWSFIIQISDQIRFRISSIVIGIALSAQFVTHYFIGARLAELFVSLVFRATNILMPVFTRYHAEGNYSEIRTKLLFFTKINAIAAVFGGGLIIMLGKPFITRWMGENYLDAYPVLVMLIIGIIFEIIINPSNNVLYAIAQHRSLALVSIVESLTNLGLSLLLIRHYGIAGVAVGTAVPLIVSRLFVLPAIVCRCIALPIKKYYWNLGGTVLFTLCYLALFYVAANKALIKADYMSLFLSAVCAVPFYSISILFISFNSDERLLLKSLLPR